MRRVVVCVLLLCGAGWAQTQTAYSNLDDSMLADNGGANSMGWGSCTTCAGGRNEKLAVIFSAPNQTTPSFDGASREFHISGPSYANGLWWYKVGANDAVSTFQFDYWLQVDSGSAGAQALEFDVFQFVGTQEYMFGTQCNYNSGFWDVWNGSAGKWMPTAIACRKFQPGVWYHITETFHRDSSNVEHYDTLTIAQYNNRKVVVSTSTFNFGLAYPSGPLPAGWHENMGVQFQIDIASRGGSISEWVDQVSLLAQ